jgi:hypothetical protein
MHFFYIDQVFVKNCDAADFFKVLKWQKMPIKMYIFSIYVLILIAIFVDLKHSIWVLMNRILK